MLAQAVWCRTRPRIIPTLRVGCSRCSQVSGDAVGCFSARHGITKTRTNARPRVNPTLRPGPPSLSESVCTVSRGCLNRQSAASVHLRGLFDPTTENQRERPALLRILADIHMTIPRGNPRTRSMRRSSGKTIMILALLVLANLAIVEMPICHRQSMAQ